MKRFGILAVTMSLLVASGDLAITTADAQTARPPPAAAELRITRAGSQPSARGPADWFSGSVRVDRLFAATAPSRMTGGSVTFEPGARSACTRIRWAKCWW
ncbi:MAG: cupin [Rhodospirillales bacterium]|jgi:hypothetical protein|nr:cupin [Rhodospirillales bacterium]